MKKTLLIMGGVLVAVLCVFGIKSFFATDRKPVANAGSDQEWAKTPGKPFRLWGTASDSDNHEIKTWKWSQVLNDAPRVVIKNANFQYPFIESYPDKRATYLFRLQVEDKSGASDDDTVKIDVWPTPVYGKNDTLTLAPGRIIHFFNNQDLSATPYIKLLPGTYNALSFINVTGGTIQKPIKIACTNKGGVRFSAQPGAAGSIRADNCKNFWLSGRNEKERYGIQCFADSTVDMEVAFGEGCSRIEVDHIFVRGGLNRKWNAPGYMPKGYGAFAFKSYPVIRKPGDSLFTKASGYEYQYVYFNNNKGENAVGEIFYFGVSHYGDFSANSYNPVVAEAPHRFLYAWNDSGSRSMMDIGQFQAVVEGLYITNYYAEDPALDSIGGQGHKHGLQIGPGARGLIENSQVVVHGNREAYAYSHQGSGETYYINCKAKGAAVGFQALRNTSKNIFKESKLKNYNHLYILDCSFIDNSAFGVQFWPNEGFEKGSLHIRKSTITNKGGKTWYSNGNDFGPLDAENVKTN